jgi:hypothetical protein
VGERNGRRMYGFVDCLIVFEDLGVGAWRAVVEDFGLGGCVGVWEESDYPRGWNLYNVIQLVETLRQIFGVHSFGTYSVERKVACSIKEGCHLGRVWLGRFGLRAENLVQNSKEY